MGETGDKRVVVIGAGIAGLVTAKVLREDGFDVVVYEREPTIGGVWAPSRTYPGLRTNNSRVTYAFSDHPFDESADMFPSADQVRAYLDSYVARFGLAPALRLGCEVESVRAVADGFVVTVDAAGRAETVGCDHVVVCTGTFSEPAMPRVAGEDAFAGTVVHSSQAADEALLAGRRVVVVGAGKSALDCAAWAGRHARACTLVFRGAHWMAPRYLPGGLRAERVVITRAAEMLFRYHRQSRVERFLHGPGRALPALFWRTNGIVFRVLLRMPAAMVPDHQLPAGIEMLGLAPDVYGLARTGQVEVRRDAIASFPGGTTVALAGGDTLEADVVVFATGFRQSFPFLAADLRAAAERDGALTLYRHILPPREPRLGFVGFASSISSQQTSEISAHWLSDVFLGRVALPSAPEMEAEVERVGAWMADVFPRRPERQAIGPCIAHHIDDLLADMGRPTRRAGNVIAEYFGGYTPDRYRTLGEERRAARGA